ncbi:CbiX/SirB N-terminal domain-containing protein [Actinoplanes sp. NPDC023801]|uniref:sirohydrochlorin chelatase n=1 Tax=Actinoplanes sp. NPDC023801 TaxID=3154595 RepID=UPI0033C62B74
MRSARLTTPRRPAVVLVAHGSRDPRAAASTSSLARAVQRARPDWTVRASYLDHAGPRPLDVLAALPGPRAVLVPLLLTAAYHGRVDLPAVIREAAALSIRVTATDVLGPASPLLLGAVSRRLPRTGLDAVVLAAAGTRNDAARQTVADAAVALGERLGLPSAVSYASGPGPRADEAVSGLRAAGARRVGMAAYFLAPGLLYDASVDAARSAGAVAVAEPLGDALELVRLIGARVDPILAGPLANAA